MHQRNAVSVLPLPVGARISVDSPRAIAGQARRCGSVAEPKRSELRKLHALIHKTLPALRPEVWGTMIGYGKYHYRYPTGRQGDCYRIAMASNKTGISVYINAVDERGYLAEQALFPVNGSVKVVTAWEPYVKNYMPNNGFDFGGRLMAAWLDK